jgi:glucose-1-phosphate thymidylyltransferase
MKVIFLCAGYGTRLYPLTENRPKPLLEIADEALLTHLVKKLDPIPSVEDIVVVSNGRFYSLFCDWRDSLDHKRKIMVINDGTEAPEDRLGAIQDLKLGFQEGKKKADTLVFAGDNLFDSDPSSFVSFSQSKRPFPCVGVFDVQDRVLAQKYGLIQTDSSGKISAFFEKPKDPPTTLASMGIYYLPKETLSLVDRYLETNRNPDAPGYYISWLSRETSVFAYPFKGSWFDIGDLNSYQKADEYFRNRNQSRSR